MCCGAGISNLVTGLTGAGFTGSYIFSQTIFSMRAGVATRIHGLIIAASEFSLFILPISIVQYLPVRPVCRICLSGVAHLKLRGVSCCVQEDQCAAHAWECLLVCLCMAPVGPAMHAGCVVLAIHCRMQ